VLGWNLLITWLALVIGLTNEDDSAESSDTAVSMQCCGECFLTFASLKQNSSAEMHTYFLKLVKHSPCSNRVVVRNQKLY